MTCAEFQRELANADDTVHNTAQAEHLRSCPVCSDLVADLRAIADQARFLTATEEPSPSVWAGIERSLRAEGLWQGDPSSAPRAFLVSPKPLIPRWAYAAAAAVLVAATVIGLKMDSGPSQQRTNATKVTLKAMPAEQQAAMPADDMAMVSVVSQGRRSASRPDFRQQLDIVNLYIADAQNRVHDNPDDEDARDDLRRALEQKQSLYELASQEWQ